MVKETTYEQMKEAIADFASCMDDFLYVYDIKQDLYYISRGALTRFQIPDNEFGKVLIPISNMYMKKIILCYLRI